MNKIFTPPLAGKRALVTGGARGIGAAIALKLAEDGADIAITYEKSAEKAEALVAEIRAMGRKAIAIRADAARTEAARATVEQTIAELGGLDILINNAGVLFASDFSTQPLEEIDLQLNINVRGVLLVTQEALKHIPNGGRIISIGSNAGLAVPFVGIAVYAATKSALESFTRGLARELGSREITVNLVRPGPIDTDMNPADGALAPAILPNLSIVRYGKAREVAEAVAFLAAPGAGYITGWAFSSTVALALEHVGAAPGAISASGFCSIFDLVEQMKTL
ncbi:short-chain dehydrogenase/reductase (plasmid) [Rhizobium tropici CIAT 899]|uniref:NAD(P)-dependent dehydrogenase (Short-subunit alcohol dehydrogenase family) n=1 Tax=Rhizobium tropici TaxID=398 RepID=A0ABR6R479_RHITR|nr:short-chain dehydrogenase/reductase [Rhizobium tropici CIAT 899]MBB4243667.1 NAD(P)-dependent dehydrogenase (short-subunit alcohol dehydrogenase family) [Rhizobium tropici]MBB5595884.1 NAD(P)-dependent dehydrogenase (short-subunit alcohol dehydrogenase family) [Rhizobium tropici]MBB6493876.1 NAD(P)-dependent dehydrogenase (short-subunit alcohol dehydrogenase family) [Rhizobium tropici]